MIDASEKRVNKLINEIADNYPAVAVSLHNMEFRPTDLIPTVACNYKGHGIYNPNFFEDKSDKNVKAILIHEALHLYFNHFKRFALVEGVNDYEEIMEDKKNDYGRKLKAWNVAADGFVNEAILETLPNGSLPTDCITFTEIKKITGLSRDEIEKSSTEDIYCNILKNHEAMQELLNKMAENLENQLQNGNGSGNGNETESGNEGSQNNQNSQGNGGKQNSQDKKDNDSGNSSQEGEGGQRNQPSPVSIIDSDIQDIIDEIYSDKKDESSKESESTENIDGKTSQAVNDLREGRRPRAGKSGKMGETNIIEDVMSVTNIEWKEILSEFVYNISGKAASGRTWQRPSRRYRDIYPISQGRKRKAKTKDFTFAIDVSGSMDKQKINRAFNVVLDYAKENDMGCKYYFWSTEKTEIFNYIDKDDFKRNLNSHYGGGTSLKCALNNYDSDSVGEGLIIVTDLEFDSITAEELNKFDGPIAFIDIEPKCGFYRKDRYISEIEKSGNKYSKFY